MLLTLKLVAFAHISLYLSYQWLNLSPKLRPSIIYKVGSINIDEGIDLACGHESKNTVSPRYTEYQVSHKSVYVRVTGIW
jgi:hypothetical protein